MGTSTPRGMVKGTYEVLISLSLFLSSNIIQIQFKNGSSPRAERTKGSMLEKDLEVAEHQEDI